MQRGMVNILIDGQWGSTGKGKLAGILIKKHNPELSICNFMTNAGHTWVSDENETVMVQQLPTSLINKSCRLHIAATGAIDPDVMTGELERYKHYDIKPRLTLDPRIAIINKKHKEEEAESLNRISSTTKGCGAAMSHKIMRHDHDVLGFSDRGWGVRILHTEEVVHAALHIRDKVLFEMAQGFDLSLNHGMRYPYTTSRDITVGQALNDACVPPSRCGTVYGSLRAFPIRVGNAYELTGEDPDSSYNGWSGPCYTDQQELTWGAIQRISGSPASLQERTTVTKKIRRVFTFSHIQLERFIRVNKPTFLFINFVNYINHKAYGLHVYTPEGRSRFFAEFPRIRAFVEEITSDHGVPVAYLGTGPCQSHIVDLGVDM